MGNSVLRIVNVTSSDLIGYKCTVGNYMTWWKSGEVGEQASGNSDARNSLDKNKSPPERTNEEQRIYNDPSSTRLYTDEGTAYEKKVYLKDSGSMVYSPAQIRFISTTQEWTFGRDALFQCVVDRGEAVWRFRVHDGKYGYCWNTDKYDACEEVEWMSLEELHDLDQYQCFHAKEKRTSTASGSMTLLRVSEISCNWGSDVVVYCLENTTNFQSGWDVRGVLLSYLLAETDRVDRWKRLGYIATGIA